VSFLQFLCYLRTWTYISNRQFITSLLIENTGDSDTGAHVNEIIASLRVDGFSEQEVRIALLNLSGDGIVYTTVDEHHYNLAADESTARESTRYAYGSGLNDMIIRTLRDLGGEICVNFLLGGVLMLLDFTHNNLNLSRHLLFSPC